MLESDHKKLDRAIHFQIPDESLVSRILGRLVHPQSGRTYHTEFCPPKVDGIDDVSFIFIDCLFYFNFFRLPVSL